MSFQHTKQIFRFITVAVITARDYLNRSKSIFTRKYKHVNIQMDLMKRNCCYCRVVTFVTFVLRTMLRPFQL